MITVLGLVGLFIILGALSLAGSQSRLFRRSFADFPDHVSTAAYRFISPPWVRPSYLGGSVSQIAERRAFLERKRLQAATLADAELRDCVFDYLDYFERKLPELERELAERISEKNLDEYRARRAANSAKADDLLKRATRKISSR